MEALSPAEALDHHAHPGPLGDDYGDYPVPQVRAPRVPPRPPTLDGGAREKTNRTKAPRKPIPGKDDDGSTLPRVASTSTVLASIGAKTNYVGPALLRSRQLGLKRSISSPGDSKEGGGEESSKKPSSESSAASASYRWYHSTHSQFRVHRAAHYGRCRKKNSTIPRAVQGAVQFGSGVGGRTTGIELEPGTRHNQGRAEDVICTKRCSNGSSYTVSRR